MKVILLGELRGKGGEGDIVEVAQGYAENYLFPNKIAQPATPGNIKQLEERRHNIEKREASSAPSPPPRSPRPSTLSSASRSTASASAAATTSRPPASTPSRSTSTVRSPPWSTSWWA